MHSKAVLLALLVAYAEARFGQEQLPISAISAVTSGGGPGVAATLGGAAISTLLGAANPCAKLQAADEIIAKLGTGADAVAAAIGLVAAEQNFNPSAVDIPNICGDPTLPTTDILRGIVPLVDPAVANSDLANQLSAQSKTTPFNADGLSVADVMAANGFTNFAAKDLSGAVVQVKAGGAGAGAAAGKSAGNAAKGTAGGSAGGSGNAGAVASQTAVADACPPATTFVTVTKGAAVAAETAAETAAAANGGNTAGMGATGNGNSKGGNGNAKGGNGNAKGGNAAGKSATGNGNAATGNGNANGGNAAGNGATGNGNAAAGNGGSQAAGADFGICDPSIKFEGGLGGRPATEFTFQAIDPVVSKGQQEALNPNIITNRVCDQLGNVCGANEAAISSCLDAKAQILALGTRDAATATKFNSLLGF